MAINARRTHALPAHVLVVGGSALLSAAILGLVSEDFGLVHLFFVATYPMAVAAIVLALRQAGNDQYSALFAYGLSLRLALVATWTLFPPAELIGRFEITGIVFKDESFYVDFGRALASHGIWTNIDLLNPYQRAAVPYALIFSAFGSSLTWSHMISALITSATSVLIYDAIVHTTSRRTHRFGWWLAGFSPVLLLWSVTYLKETYLTFGIALIINSLLMNAQRRSKSRSLFYAGLGATICLWYRGPMLVVPAILSAIALVCHNLETRRRIFLPAVAGTAIGIILIATSAELVALAIGHGATVLERTSDLVQRGDFTKIARFPFFNLISGLPPGFIQSTGFAVLLLISPVITGVWNLIPFIGDPSWEVFAVSAYALSWWVCLPLWIACTVAAVKRRDGWWIALVGWLVLWIFMSAAMRAGIGYDSFRYRDALMPLIAVLAALGLDSIHTGALNRAKWNTALKSYWTVILALILLRGVGILQM